MRVAAVGCCERSGRILRCFAGAAVAFLMNAWLLAIWDLRRRKILFSINFVLIFDASLSFFRGPGLLIFSRLPLQSSSIFEPDLYAVCLRV